MTERIHPHEVGINVMVQMPAVSVAEAIQLVEDGLKAQFGDENVSHFQMCVTWRGSFDRRAKGKAHGLQHG